MGQTSRSWADWSCYDSWSAESMHPVHKSMARGSKGFSSDFTWLPLVADCLLIPFPPMPVPPRQAAHHVLDAAH